MEDRKQAPVVSWPPPLPPPRPLITCLATHDTVFTVHAERGSRCSRGRAALACLVVEGLVIKASSLEIDRTDLFDELVERDTAENEREETQAGLARLLQWRFPDSVNEGRKKNKKTPLLASVCLVWLPGGWLCMRHIWPSQKHIWIDGSLSAGAARPKPLMYSNAAVN